LLRQGKVAAINGLWLKMLDGDSVTATMKDTARHDVEAACEIISSRDDRVEVRVPAAFDDESFIGKEIVFAVTNSCGQPGMTQQTKRVTATLLAGDVPPGPTPPEPIAQSSDGKVKVMSATGGGEGGAFTPDGDWTLAGEGLWGEFAEGRTWILSAPEVSAGGASYPATFGELAGGVAKVTLDHAPEEPGEYAAELSFSLTNVDPEVDSETLRVPFTLVVE
jgi:hypothetical protein